MKTALILVDIQMDFVSGSLPVPGAERCAQAIGAVLDSWGNTIPYELVVASRDNHIQGSNGGHFSNSPDYKDTFPPHCVVNTRGAELHPAIAKHLDKIQAVFYKGMGEPAFSPF